MNTSFEPKALPLLIGSLPLADHGRACDLIFEHTPEIPVWPQLPCNPGEKMVPQFMSGLPGIKPPVDDALVDTGSDDYEQQLVEFYQVYLDASENISLLENTALALATEAARGFFVFLERMSQRRRPVSAVKGQITGPFTFCTGVADQDKRALIYDDTLRDAGVKLMALKAAWQVHRLAGFGVPVIIFIDEPALAGFGSSEFISISRQQVGQMLQEVIDAVHRQGGLAGIHVCANTDWSLILESGADIVNFDAFGYFNRFALYGDAIRSFVENGGILAWGQVPTGHAENIEAATIDDLYGRLRANMEQVAALGLDRELLFRRSLITPSCGTGSLTSRHAVKVLALTRDLSRRLRSDFGRTD